MPSTNKTPTLRLNQWLETDKPTRADFVADNSIVDTVIGGHIMDAMIHLTSDEKTRVSTPFEFRVVQGTDTAERAISLGYRPKIVIYYAFEYPPVEIVSGKSVINFGFAVQGYGGSGGCVLAETELIVNQASPSGAGYVFNLNNSDYQYLIVTFR